MARTAVAIALSCGRVEGGSGCSLMATKMTRESLLEEPHSRVWPRRLALWGIRSMLYSRQQIGLVEGWPN
ncbi:hypothetical protein SNA_00180 [Streptomyces natalensis ATCC 27448]|uniref:Uncharacterized protein n=1 Tax=Streptomyces natalensis ATCC 27448 TaxID=1240678 RepID=A0A0D7CUA2_9ACTN|nr:hypothetical protein SNA_00180 [Streptomyces natalensis ATCC 27448]